MTFKVEEERDNVEEVGSLEEKCVGANAKVSFKGKSDEENSRGSDSGEVNKTSEEVGGCNRVGGSFEEKLEGVDMTVTRNGIEEEVCFRVGGRQGESEESESDKDESEMLGYRVGGRQGDPEEDKSSKSEKDESEEVGYKVGGRQGEGAGRFLLATKTFQPGQPVLMETPLVQVQQGIYTKMGGNLSN